jgi:DegV family protein with EDD domain
LKIAVITDSTCTLTKEEQQKYNINVLSTPISIGGQEYREGVNITSGQLFEKINAGEGFPKTSQPSMGEALELCQNLHDEGYEAIILITLTSTISGFYNTMQNIANLHPEFNLHPYDSHMTVKMQGYLAIAAAIMAQNGLEPDEIIKRLDQLRATIDEFFIVNDLSYLSRGGRLSNASAFVGTLLQIKPLLTFDNDSGKIVAFDKVRSMKRALAKIEKLAEERIEKLDYRDKLRFLIIHSNDENQAKSVSEDIKKTFPGQPVEIVEFSPAIATHLGEKSLGIAWMYDPFEFNLDK